MTTIEKRNKHLEASLRLWVGRYRLSPNCAGYGVLPCAVRYAGDREAGDVTGGMPSRREMGGHAHLAVAEGADEVVGLAGLHDVVRLPLTLAQILRLPPLQDLHFVQAFAAWIH